MDVKVNSEKLKWIKKINGNSRIFNKLDIIEKVSKGKDVLDVGCVGQDIDYNNPLWMHNKIKKIANQLVGVDIVREEIQKLQSYGYDVYHFDELSKIHKKFDVILMLDVIEHVENPILFLNTYKQYLKKDGKIIVTTPNSNRVINFITILLKNDYSINYEHTFWLCPKTFLEIVNRAERLEVSDFYWLDFYNVKRFNNNWKKKVIYYISRFLMNLRSNFSPNFMFILKKKKK